MKTPTMLSTLKQKFTNAITDIHTDIGTRREQIRGLRQQLHRAQTAPLPLQEVVADRIPAAVRRAGEYGIKRYAKGLIFGERSLGNPNLVGSASLPWTLDEPVCWSVLCAAAPETAIAILSALAGQVVYDEGPSSATRPALIARLTRELDDACAAEEALIDEACAAGVVIAHRPEVIARRTDEAGRRERAERDTQNRRERQAALDANRSARFARHTPEYLSGRTGPPAAWTA